MVNYVQFQIYNKYIAYPNISIKFWPAATLNLAAGDNCHCLL